MTDIERTLARIEATQQQTLSILRTLLAALDEDPEPEDLTLDGGPAGRERDQTQSL